MSQFHAGLMETLTRGMTGTGRVRTVRRTRASRSFVRRVLFATARSIVQCGSGKQRHPIGYGCTG